MSEIVGINYLARWILKKYNTKTWREGGLGGMTETKEAWKCLSDIPDEIADSIGRREAFFSWAKDLEKEGYIKVKYKGIRSEISAITIDLDRLDDLYLKEGLPNPRYKFEDKKQEILKYIEFYNKNEKTMWLSDYYEYLLEKVAKAKKELPTNAKDENLFKCLNYIAELEEDVVKRKLSHDVFGASKIFEENYQNKVSNILLQKYNIKEDKEKKDVEEINEIERDEILAEYHIVTYSQTIEFKGDICYKTVVGDKSCDIYTNHFPYGHIMNAKSLENSKVIEAENIKYVLTIENKANYESLFYRNDCLIIYTHGFLSKKERNFLNTLWDCLAEDVEIYHWSDLDYGGIRIYQFMKDVVCKSRDILPYKMGEKDYKIVLESRKGTELSETTRARLEKMEVKELQELKDCILKYGMVFEQEYFI